MITFRFFGPGVPASGRDEVYFSPLAGAGEVGVLLALGRDDGEGACGGRDEGPSKSPSSSIFKPGREGGSTRAIVRVFTISLMLWQNRPN
jgi:hypothetical protein